MEPTRLLFTQFFFRKPGGVRADLCSMLIDDAGQVVSSSLDQVGLALMTKQGRRIPEIIGIAGGLEKADAILAALRVNWLTTLVINARGSTPTFGWVGRTKRRFGNHDAAFFVGRRK
jgi:hypothetical protein